MIAETDIPTKDLPGELCRLAVICHALAETETTKAAKWEYFSRVCSAAAVELNIQLHLRPIERP